MGAYSTDAVFTLYPTPRQSHDDSSFHHIFSRVSAADRAGQQFLVRASYMEIYNEEIRDLLAKDPKCV